VSGGAWPIEPRAICIFVYGTLRTGGAAHDALRGCEHVASATVPGTLYDIDGRFPALMLYGGTAVRGEVWRCPDALLPRLDAYEGVESGLFRRVGVRVGEHACWTYVAGPALARQLTAARRLHDGDWLGRRRERTGGAAPAGRAAPQTPRQPNRNVTP
jgi:gamma-glutamylaminecyclotransferase